MEKVVQSPREATSGGRKMRGEEAPEMQKAGMLPKPLKKTCPRDQIVPITSGQLKHGCLFNAIAIPGKHTHTHTHTHTLFGSQVQGHS